MDTLPDEILLRVFQAVPQEDRRKNIQLVCQRWRRICLDPFIPSNKLLTVVSRVHNFSYLTPLLKSTVEPLELLCVQMPISVEDDSEFWTSCGPRIKSLFLRDCSINFKDFQAIFSLCPNLSSLSMTYVTQSALDKFFQNYNPHEHAGGLLSSVSSVTSVRVRWNYTLIKGWWFPKNILVKFPSADTIELSSVPYEKPTEAFFSKLKTLPRDGWPTTDDERAYIQVLKNVKKLIVSWNDFETKYSRLGYLTHCRRHVNSLQKLSVSTSFTSEDYNFMQNLTSLSALQDRHELLYTFMTIMLHCLPKLRILKLGHMLRSEIDVIVIRQFLDTGLKMLQISLEKDLNGFGRMDGSFRPNKTLEAFALLGNDFADEKLGLIFTQVCQNLKYIFITNPSDAILQNIFKYQKNIVNLTLDDCSNCTNFGFTGISQQNEIDKNEENSYSMKDLTELQCLQVTSLQLQNITEKTFSHFVLPKLKCLKIIISDPTYEEDASKETNHSEELLGWTKKKTGIMDTTFESTTYDAELSAFEALVKSLTNSPLLEILHIKFLVKVPKNIWLPTFTKLKRIRYLTIHGLTDMIEDSRQAICFELFQKCPSLCALVENEKQYYRNKLTNKIEEKVCEEHHPILPSIMEELCLKWPYSFHPIIDKDFHYL